ncbi:MAG: TrmJ/YjtD family RNA methyltransferase [Burkholderiales bacterium]|jgi:tRNA/rRNA methyltransferase|nr:TrmJ/YjtD family RNA methyltransferase [Burkholderiales bacterium]
MLKNKLPDTLGDTPSRGNAENPSFFDRVRFVLERPSHPGNIGAAARALATMGFSRLYLVAPKRFPAPEATAMASGATDVLDHVVVVDCLPDALKGVTFSAGFSARPRELVGGIMPLDLFAQTCVSQASILNRGQPLPEIALVFGTEMTGLSNDALSYCQTAVTIPANPNYSSLNLAQAVQVAAYALRVASGNTTVWQASREKPATFEELEGLKAHAKETLTKCGFLNPKNPKKLMPRLARLFARAKPEHDEVNILRGILSQMDRLMDKNRQENPSLNHHPAKK